MTKELVNGQSHDLQAALKAVSFSEGKDTGEAKEIARNQSPASEL